MNTQLVAVFSLIVVVLLVDIKATCDFGCRLDCRTIPCKLKCDMICRRRRAAEQATGSNPLAFQFPREFGVYDDNNNSFINLEELAGLIGTHSSNEGVRKAFFLADRNGDMQISPEEFENAQWDFVKEADSVPESLQ